MYVMIIQNLVKFKYVPQKTMQNPKKVTFSDHTAVAQSTIITVTLMFN